MGFHIIVALLSWFCFGFAALPSSSTSKSYPYCESTTSGADFTFCYEHPLSWYTETYTASLRTKTYDAWTKSATEETFTLTHETYPGLTDTSPYSTMVFTETAATYSAETETVPGFTTTVLQTPIGLKSDYPDNVLALLYDFAPQITGLSYNDAAKLNRDIYSLDSSYASATPQPTIMTKVFDDLDKVFSQNQVGFRTERSILRRMGLFPSSSEAVRTTSELYSLLSPYPSLSSEVVEYMSVASTWFAPLYLAEVSVVVKDLNLTTPLPSWLTTVSAALPTSTGGGSSPKPNAAPSLVSGSLVLLNACIAMTGLLLISML